MTLKRRIGHGPEEEPDGWDGPDSVSPGRLYRHGVGRMDMAALTLSPGSLANRAGSGWTRTVNSYYGVSGAIAKEGPRDHEENFIQNFTFRESVLCLLSSVFCLLSFALSLHAGGATPGECFHFGQLRHGHVAGECREQGAVGPAKP